MNEFFPSLTMKNLYGSGPILQLIGKTIGKSLQYWKNWGKSWSDEKKKQEKEIARLKKGGKYITNQHNSRIRPPLLGHLTEFRMKPVYLDLPIDFQLKSTLPVDFIHKIPVNIIKNPTQLSITPSFGAADITGGKFHWDDLRDGLMGPIGWIRLGMRKKREREIEKLKRK